MLIPSARILNTPILSLHLGRPIARTLDPIIDPNSLKIIAFTLEVLTPNPEAGDILKITDIREFSRLGIIVDSDDEFVNRPDVIKIDKVMSLNFHLIGLKVRTKSGEKLGKITDYNLDPTTFSIQQLIVKRPFTKAFIDPELVINRNQILEITDTEVILKEEKQKAKSKAAPAQSFTPNFINPFREAAPETATPAESES